MENFNNILKDILPFSVYNSFSHINKLMAIEIIIYIFIIYIIAKLVRFLKKPLKYYLFTKRADSFYRYLYFRVDKIIKPIIFLVDFYFVNLIIKKIFALTETSDYLLFTFIVNLFLVLWFFYEVVKFLIYSTLRKRIKSQQNARRELFNLFLNITKIAIVLIATIAILTKFGIDITALITSLGIGGVIIGLSAKDTLVNFFDSIRLISEDAFRQGDWVQTRDVEGFVTELGLTSTQIRTFDNAMVTIPNSKLANDYIKNWSKRVIGRRIKFHLPIKFTNDTDEIDRIIYEIYEMLHSHPDIMNLNKLRYLRKMKKTYEDGLFNIEDKYGVRRTLLVYLDEIGEYSMNILIYAFSISVNWEEWLRVKQDVLKKIIKIIDQSELEFAYPTNEILLQNRGNK